MVNVTMLLFTPSKVACTLIWVPGVAPPEIVPAPLPWVNVKSVVLELFQVTEVVMSCWPLVPGNVAIALNVTELAGDGFVGVAVRVIDVGVPAVTVTVVVAGLAVLKEALT